MKEVPGEIRKILIKRLKEYRFMQNELIAIEEELDSTPADDNGNIKSKYKVSKKTENMAIKLAENEKYQEVKVWKRCLDDLFIKYDKNSLKWKFIQRRYLLCDTVRYKWNKSRNLKDIDVYKDLQLEGYDRDEKTFRRMKNNILYDLYKEALKNNLIKF